MFHRFLTASTFILAISVSVMLFILTYNLLEMWGKQIQSEYSRLTAPPSKDSHE